MIQATCAGCGRAYWPLQEWQHKACMVANTSDISDVVANSTMPVVANKHGRYADTNKRRAYMREYMAKRRAGIAAEK